MNIEAIGLDDVVITDGNGTIISHHAAKTATKRESSPEAAGNITESETKDRRRREADEKNENGEDKSDIAPVSSSP